MTTADKQKTIATPDTSPCRVVSLTRCLVQAALRDSDSGDQKGDVDVDSAQPIPGHDSGSDEPEIVLRDTRNWLESLAQRERKKTNQVPEYTFRRIVVDPEGSVFPFLAPGEGVESDTPQAILVKSPGLALDTSVLDRIREGRGPRDFEPEDLVAKLRVGTSADTSSTCSTFSSEEEETYQGLLDVLFNWNRHVGQYKGLVKERKELLDALEERNHLITDIERGHKKSELLEKEISRLKRALKVFRPELATFEDQRVGAHLVMMVANFRIAIPDIDDELKYALIKTIAREVRLAIHFEKEYVARRAQLRALAKATGSSEEVQRLAQKRLDLNAEVWSLTCAKTIDIIKEARTELCERVLEDLNDLVAQQAGQKWAAYDASLASTCLPDTEWEEAQHTLRQTINKSLGPLEDMREVASFNIEEMKRLNRNCIGRTIKFAALDVHDPIAREHVRKERLEEPATARMMMKVVEEAKVMQDMSHFLSGRMETLENSLETALAAANAQLRAYDGMLAAVDSMGTESCESKMAGNDGKSKENIFLQDEEHKLNGDGGKDANLFERIWNRISDRSQGQ